MAVMDWDREVTLTQTSKSSLPSVIRGYDEPDTNLDFQAQQKMYHSISDIVDAPNSRVQAVICTHSPRLIDRAPARSIRLLHREDGSSEVAQLETDDDPGVEQFLTVMARDLGLSNTLMFYEQCFILIEGATEENALPLFYRTIYGHSLLEDGIRLVNVQNNGAFKEFLRLLSRNRQEITLVFTDLDTKTSPTGRRLTTDILRHSYFDADFIKSHVYYVPADKMGNNGVEFEAAFSNATIAKCLQTSWPRTPVK
jgi:putative ATP-dependent endonuclease of the OLD family